MSTVAACGRTSRRPTADDWTRVRGSPVSSWRVQVSIPDSTFGGVLNGGHPGGTLPLTQATAETFHDDRLPENVYVADSTLLPRSLGLPPILTIVALATRVARIAARSVPSARRAA